MGSFLGTESLSSRLSNIGTDSLPRPLEDQWRQRPPPPAFLPSRSVCRACSCVNPQRQRRATLAKGLCSPGSPCLWGREEGPRSQRPRAQGGREGGRGEWALARPPSSSTPSALRSRKLDQPCKHPRMPIEILFLAGRRASLQWTSSSTPGGLESWLPRPRFAPVCVCVGGHHGVFLPTEATDSHKAHWRRLCSAGEASLSSCGQVWCRLGAAGKVPSGERHSRDPVGGLGVGLSQASPTEMVAHGPEPPAA